MDRTMVTYKVKADRVVENEALVKAVYAQLHELAPVDVHYATFKLDDGQTFVHIASFASEEGRVALTTCDAFKAFQADIKGRCETPPAPQKLAEVGFYQFEA